MKLKTTFTQKTILVFFGIFLSFFLLEAGLRICGFTLTYIQEHRNRVSLKKGGDYRILCLGESTTQGEWPPFLEAALNRNGMGMQFTVIDEGWSGTTTTRILNVIESYLDKYKPDMVVVMMGINDPGAAHLPEEDLAVSRLEAVFKPLKIYKLTRLLVHTALKTGGWTTLPAPDAHAPATRPITASPTGPHCEDTAPIKNLKQELQLNPGNVNVYLKLAKLYRHQRQFHLAELQLQKALLIAPGNSEVYDFLGKGYYDQEKFQQAEEQFKKALQLNPGNSEIYNALGRTYWKQNKYQQAEEQFKKAIQITPGHEPSHFSLGWTYHRQDKLQQAVEEFTKAIQITPGNDRGHLELGRVYHTQRKYKQAEEECKKALKLNPRNVGIYDTLGRLYWGQRKFQQAEEMFKKGLALRPGNEKRYIELGALYHYQGKFPQAEEMLIKALQINPGNDSAYHGLEYLSRNKDRFRHETYYQKAIRLHTNGYNPVTANNYRALKNILDKRKIQLVCVQYPMRDVESLKNIFMGTADNIVFVDNKYIFIDAIRQDGFFAYFRDAFGGNFGHATDKGNKLLGENIAKVIIKEVWAK